MAGRTIVVSDIHGFNALLEGALTDAGYSDDDKLVLAGDLVDIGPDDTVSTAESLGATILAGNHEVSAALGLEISPQSEETRKHGRDYARKLQVGQWPLALAVEGWLITHGGLSTLFGEEIERSRGDVDRLAEELNGAFVGEIARFLDGEMSAYSLGRSRIVGSELGPLWFRAARPELVPGGIRQVVGHTPCELYTPEGLAVLAAKNFLLIDPGAHLGAAEEGSFRYAVIENGEARVVNGCAERHRA